VNRLFVASLAVVWTLTGCGSSAPPEAAGPAEDVQEDTAIPDCPCEPEEHCGPGGACQPDVCVEGGATCATVFQIKYCDDTGASFSLVDCDQGFQCEVGACEPVVCEPGITDCQNGHKVTCNSLGTRWVPVPCPETDVCKDGECVFVQPNILLLVDTSYSMNRVIGSDETPATCTGDEGCPPWTYPSCDDPADPATRLGVVKEILDELATTSGDAGLRMALQRFPQTQAAGGTCANGHYGSLETMTLDNDAHDTRGEEWFQIYQGEAVIVPFDAEGGSGADDIQLWCDFEESTLQTGASCDHDSDCDNGFCWIGGCKTHDKHELRGMGQTPLGRSLFYAGEYLRHAVFVEGTACVEDSDCHSPHHACVEGACHDPLGKCRNTRIIVFTDGVESANHELTDFYHPRVQAKRLHHGLGCETLDECVGGATCDEGICRPPPGVVPETEKACTVYETTCEADEGCPDFACGSGELCDGSCQLASVSYDDDAGGDRLTDAAGTPVSVQIHVVDASGYEGANRFIAAYGGGEHVSVDLGAASTVVATVLPLLDAKVSPDGEVCDLEAE